ncbi:hypothetical protein [Micromonospora sp. WMMD980]|uniref:hypothetical protein n=1 Tax=Micromonospora sp. WMMD980 TaxID=3016088 RepID=UPI00241745D8|nr:hypothetical protein [Micromonospora sp. WMMD980]MDG4804141.1 hypothetical protein [Micromonospora sp. WMMD980]
MPADRDPHAAYGQPPGLWPGQDISHQSDRVALPWPDARAALAPPARLDAHGDLPWPERGVAGHEHPDQSWPTHDQSWSGHDRSASGRDQPGWGHDQSWSGPDATSPVGADRATAGWGHVAATATLTGPPHPDAPVGPHARPAVGGPGQPPPPPGSPAPPPGRARRRWRMMTAAAVVLAVAGGGVAVAALRPDATNPQAGEVPTTVGPKPSAGLGVPAGPGAASPKVAQGVGGKPAAKPSASAGANAKGFAGTRLTLPGASIGVQSGETFGQALTRSDQTFGKLQMARIFFPGMPPAWKGSRADVVDRTVVVSFKASPQEINSGRHDARLASWFASIPRDHNVYWSYFHEPEDDVERGAFTTDAYRAAWKRVAGLAARADNAKLINTLILMCWTLDSKSGRSFDAFYPGGDVIEALGWDCYNWGKKWKRYASPQEIYGPIINKSKALGKPWGVAETGSDLVPGDSGAGRATWIRAMTSYLNGQRPEFVAYYNQTVSQGDFRLLDRPSIQAWKSFCVA